MACCYWPPKARGAQMPRFRQTTNNIIGKMAAADDVPRFDIILSDIDLENIVKDKDSKET